LYNALLAAFYMLITRRRNRYKCDYPLVSDPWSCNCLCPRWPVDLTDSALCADGEHVPLGGCGCQDCAECPPYKVLCVRRPALRGLVVVVVEAAC